MGVANHTESVDEDLLNNDEQHAAALLSANPRQGERTAIQNRVDRIDKTRLARACRLVDPIEEKALADAGLASEGSDWLVY